MSADLLVPRPAPAPPVDEAALRSVLRAAALLRDRLDEPLTVRDAADHAGYSPFHLSRLFSRVLGTSPVQYLAAHRFQRAKTLLLDGPDSVADICMAVGFTSVGTFTRRFAQEVGTSPRDFRRLPDTLRARDVRPATLAGPGHGVVRGTIRVTPQGAAVVGPRPQAYVGLFPRPVARGTPVAGVMLPEPGAFVITGAPAGWWWLLAAAVPYDDPVGQLLVEGRVTAGADQPVLVLDGRLAPAPAATPRHDLSLAPASPWSFPVTAALPVLGR